MSLISFIKHRPVVPYIRESDLPSREAYYFPSRRLLDYLLIYVEKGTLHITADSIEHRLEEGQFCLLQPGTVHDLRAYALNETPFAHLDFFMPRIGRAASRPSPGRSI